MKDQHRFIPGYRDLGADEMEDIKFFKEWERRLETLCTSLDETIAKYPGDPVAARWASLARTHLEIGMMFAIKAIAKPTMSIGRKGSGAKP